MPSTHGLLLDIVTGASQGIGKAIAESIAHTRANTLSATTTCEAGASTSSYKLILVGRNMERGSRVAEEITKSSGLMASFEVCDLGNFQQVQDLKRRIQKEHEDQTTTPIRIGVLMNYAAECPQQQRLVQHPRRVDTEGNIVTETIDAQFATNVLGYHFMMKTFEDWYSDGDGNEDFPTRIVNIASNWAGDLDLNDLHFQKRSYDNDTAYRQSKQCDRMLNVMWAERMRGQHHDNVLVNACHPGDPRTTLSCALGYNTYAAEPDRRFVQNRNNPIMHLCGLGKNSLTTTGGWYDGTISPQKDPYANRREQAQELFRICESF